MESSDPRVSVVMITRDRRDEVLRTLGELASLPERPRVVIVDNGSTDGTDRAVAEQFPDVTFLPQGENLGAAARNIGVRTVTTPYVAFCDDDSWWDPGHLARAADLLDAHPRVATITARILVGPEERLDPTCILLRDSPIPAEPGLPGPALLGFLAGATIVRRSAFLEAGGFERRFGVGGEEELLAVDLACRGWWLCYVPELVVHHHPSQRRDPSERRWTMLRNALWFAWLRRPWPGLLRKTARLIRSSPSARTTLRGVYAALAELPWVVRSRRVVPPHVEAQIRLLEGPTPIVAPKAPEPARA